jgi:Fe-S-cluster containining protein
MDGNNATIEPACRRRCPDRWCCSSRYLVQAPVWDEEINRIARYTGRIDFHERRGDERVLRIRPDGYCVFFDQANKTCTIYAVRPFDCGMYPFDFYTAGGDNRWLLWDCAYSRQMDEVFIERALTRFERRHRHALHRIWHYENESIDPTRPVGFRVLRPMRVAGPSGDAGQFGDPEIAPGINFSFLP